MLSYLISTIKYKNLYNKDTCKKTVILAETNRIVIFTNNTHIWPLIHTCISMWKLSNENYNIKQTNNHFLSFILEVYAKCCRIFPYLMMGKFVEFIFSNTLTLYVKCAFIIFTIKWVFTYKICIPWYWYYHNSQLT